MLVDPMDGTLDSEGSAMLHFTRSAETSATVRVNCKVCLCTYSTILTAHQRMITWIIFFKKNHIFSVQWSNNVVVAGLLLQSGRGVFVSESCFWGSFYPRLRFHFDSRYTAFLHYATQKKSIWLILTIRRGKWKRISCSRENYWEKIQKGRVLILYEDALNSCSLCILSSVHLFGE